jgi:hypothetical protein
VSLTVDELELALTAAQERVARAVRALASKRTLKADPANVREATEYRIAFDEQLRLEREVAQAKGDEVAAVIHWRPRWDVGAPLPYVVSSGSRTFLIYMVRDPDPGWDGTYTNVVDPTSDGSAPLAIVEFERCYAHKFGGSNDEVIEGHPLYGSGLEGYRAHEVLNSRWLATEQAINRVHPGYWPETWTKRKHYLLAFHDEYFECLADGYAVEVVRCTFREAVARVVARLFEK